tara:strand:- start:1377 stop:1922 length:546 start_codon:yes stop_codon:yes gene_type:complete
MRMDKPILFSSKIVTCLRPAETSDREATFSLYEELFRNHIEQIWGWDDDWQSQNFETDWTESDFEIIEFGGVQVGYLQTQLRSDPKHLFVINLGLRSQFQDQGIGTEVMHILETRAGNLDVPIRLNVFRTNPAALRFYTRLGYEQDEVTESGAILIRKSSTESENPTGEQADASKPDPASS